MIFFHMCLIMFGFKLLYMVTNYQLISEFMFLTSKKLRMDSIELKNFHSKIELIFSIYISAPY